MSNVEGPSSRWAYPKCERGPGKWHISYQEQFDRFFITACVDCDWYIVKFIYGGHPDIEAFGMPSARQTNTLRRLEFLESKYLTKEFNWPKPPTVKVLQLGRGEGKTFELMKWASEDKDRIVVVMNEPNKRSLQRAYKYALFENQIISINDLLTDRKRGINKEYAFDNIDMILKSLVGYSNKVSIISLTA